MKWLRILGVLFDWILNRTRGSTTSDHIFHSEAATQDKPKLTREDVVKMIERNGGPEGLCLAGYDLSGANLAEMNLRGVLRTCALLVHLVGRLAAPARGSCT